MKKAFIAGLLFSIFICPSIFAQSSVRNPPPIVKREPSGGALLQRDLTIEGDLSVEGLVFPDGTTQTTAATSGTLLNNVTESDNNVIISDNLSIDNNLSVGNKLLVGSNVLFLNGETGFMGLNTLTQDELSEAARFKPPTSSANGYYTFWANSGGAVGIYLYSDNHENGNIDRCGIAKLDSGIMKLSNNAITALSIDTAGASTLLATTVTTLDTGYGAKELGQSNRTTDSMTFADVSVSNNLSVNQNVDVTGDVQVDGASTLTGAVGCGAITSTSTITGVDDLTISSSGDVRATIKAGAGQISELVWIRGAYDDVYYDHAQRVVDGDYQHLIRGTSGLWEKISQFDDDTWLFRLYNDLSVNSTVTVSGELWVNGSLVIPGAGGATTDGGATTYVTGTDDNFAIGGTDSTNSKFFFNEANGDLSVSNDITVGGNVYGDKFVGTGTSGAMNVDGDGEFDGDLTANGMLITSDSGLANVLSVSDSITNLHYVDCWYNWTGQTMYLYSIQAWNADDADSAFELIISDLDYSTNLSISEDVTLSSNTSSDVGSAIDIRDVAAGQVVWVRPYSATGKKLSVFVEARPTQ